MARHGRRAALALVLAALPAATGCATQSAGDGYPLHAHEMSASGRGAWIEAATRTGGRVAGELITGSADSLWVLQLDGAGAPRLHVLPLLQVHEARVERWRSQEGELYGLGLGGSLMTLSHGYWLVFTAPIWWISSALGGVAEARSARLLLEVDGWGEMARWARFPAGWPEGVPPERRAILVLAGER